MHADLLTREEIASLLDSEGPESPVLSALAPGAPQPELQAGLPIARLEPRQTLLARSLGAALSALVKTVVTVRLARSERVAADDFLFGLENPTLLHVVHAPPLDESLLLEISPAALFPLLDRLLGGSGEPSALPDRAPTELEQRLASRIGDLFLGELAQCWQDLLPIRPELAHVLCEPPAEPLPLAGGELLRFTFEVALDGALGSITLGVPCRALARALAAGRQQTRQEPPEAGGPAPYIVAAPSRSDGGVEVVARLAVRRIGAAELLSISEGAILTTEQRVGEPIVVTVDGVARYRAQPGAHQGHKAVRLLAPPDAGAP